MINNESINITLSNYIETSSDDASLPRNELSQFIRDPTRKLALIGIKEILKPHEKIELLTPLLMQLSDIERGTILFAHKHRDHIVHSLLCYILGRYIYDNKLKGIQRIDDFSWKIAALLHDVGYAIEIANVYLLNDFTKKIDQICTKLKLPSSNMEYRVIPVGIESLSAGYCGYCILQKCLNEWELEYITVADQYKRIVQGDEVRHGFIGAMTTLKLIDLLYAKQNSAREEGCVVDNQNGHINWDRNEFDKQVVHACAAIFLHNLYPDCFDTEHKIVYEKAPLAYLLTLTDELQDWDRPGGKKTHKYKAKDYGIRICGEKIVYMAPSCRIMHIEKGLNTRLYDWQSYISIIPKEK